MAEQAKSPLLERLNDWRDYEPAKMFGGEILGDIAEAAETIAELLAALKALVPEDFDQHPQDFAPEWHKARAAIAKARGDDRG